MITNPVVATQGTGISLLQTLIPVAISWCFIIGTVIFFFMLLFGGIQWISSGGDKGKIEGAKGKISSAIIGLIVLFAVFVIIQLVGLFFKVNLLQLNLPTISNSSSGGNSNTCTGFVCQGPTHCQLVSGIPQCISN